MDGRRLIAIAALAAGCRGAAADPARDAGAADLGTSEPRHGIDVPARWQELPAISDAAVNAAREVLGADADVHAHAWGETARGCYLAIVEAHGAKRDSIAAIVAAIEPALDEGLTLSDWTSAPDADDRAAIGGRFAGTGPAAMRGLIRASVVLDRRKLPHALAAACFSNDRQPQVCDDACAPLLEMLDTLTPPSGP